jgi:hypothetical protein
MSNSYGFPTFLSISGMPKKSIQSGCRPHLAQLLHISESDEDYEALASSSPVSG